METLKRIIRSAYRTIIRSHLLLPGRMVPDIPLLAPSPTDLSRLTWEFEEYPGLWREMEPRMNDILNQARSSAHQFAEYVWRTAYHGRVYHTRYEFDLVALTQTNTDTLTVRQIRAIIVVRSEAMSDPMRGTRVPFG
jgi:hypothetical protein